MLRKLKFCFINLFTAPKDGTAGMAMDAGAAGTVVGTYWFDANRQIARWIFRWKILPGRN